MHSGCLQLKVVQARVTFSSFWKCIVLLHALKKMGSATLYVNKKMDSL